MEAAASVGIRIPSLCYLKEYQRDCGLPHLPGGAGGQGQADYILQQCRAGRHGDLYEQPEGKKCPPYECAADPVPA